MKGKDGVWYILEDNLRIPSGASYPLIARSLCRRCSPDTFRHNGVVDNRNYGDLLRATMDSEYLAGRTLSALGEMALQYLILAAACAAACVLTALGRRLWRQRGGRIRREEGLHATAA